MSYETTVLTRMMTDMKYHPERNEYLSGEFNYLFSVIPVKRGDINTELLCMGAQDLARLVAEGHISFFELCMMLTSAIGGLVLQAAENTRQDPERLSSAVLAVLDVLMRFCVRRLAREHEGD